MSQKVAAERIIKLARQIAKTGRHNGWYYVAAELQFDKGEPLALSILEKEPIRSELDRACEAARSKQREDRRA